MLTLYGLPHCDSCRKARAWLDAIGIEHAFIDYRAEPMPLELVARAAARLGWPKLVNRASTTWRQLPEARKDPQSEEQWMALVREYPTLVRRPLLVHGEHIEAGFKADRYARLFQGGAPA